MTHTVISSHAAAHGCESPRHGVDAPTVGEFWHEPVLTVESNGRTVDILFNEPGPNSVLGGPAVVIGPWSDLNVRIQGEDLYAFRELLNELPESAFVRPADPVNKTAWVEGDKVVNIEETGHAWLYIRNSEGTWKPIGFGRGKDGRPSQDGRAIVTDFEIDHCLASPNYDGFNVLRRGGKEL